MRGLLLIVGIAAVGMLILAGKDTAPAVPAGTVPVRMIVTAEARHGKDIPTLGREDVTAWQGKERLPVTEIVPLQDMNASLDLVILLDDASATSLGSQLGDLRKFIETQPPTTVIAIGYMRNGTFDMVRNFTSDHTQAASGLRLPLSSGGAMASPYLSLTDLIARWPATPTRHEVVMVTSGVDPLGGTGMMNAYLLITIEDAQRSGTIVYPIYTPEAGHSGHSVFRLTWAQNDLAQLAEETGGEAYMLGFAAPVSFAPYLDEIAAHLMHQYSVTFLIKPEKKAGFRSVRFSTEVANADLVAATKVYVPASSR